MLFSPKKTSSSTCIYMLCVVMFSCFFDAMRIILKYWGQPVDASCTMAAAVGHSFHPLIPLYQSY